MDVRATASLGASPRVGVVIPKYKHNSVDRNRLKRRVRELVRLEWLPTLPAMDVVVRVTPVAYDRTFDGLRDEMRQVGQRLLRVSLPTVRPPVTSPVAPPATASDIANADTPGGSPA